MKRSVFVITRRYLLAISLALSVFVIFILNNRVTAEESSQSKVSLEDFEYSNQKELIDKFVNRQWSTTSQYQVILEAKNVHSGKASVALIYKPFSASGWVQIQKDFPVALNWQDFDGIAVWIYGDGSNSEINVKFKDASNAAWRSPWVKVDWQGWEEVRFKFPDFRRDLFDPESSEGKSVMSLEEIKSVAFGMRGERNSTIFLDDVNLVSEKAVNRIKLAGEYDLPANFYLWTIEDFEYQDEEALSRAFPRSLKIYDTGKLDATLNHSQTKSGNNSLRLEFNPKADSARSTIRHMYPIAKDWSESSGISFWLYGSGSSDEFALILTDNDNENYQIPWIRLGWKGWKQFYYDFDRLIRDEFDFKEKGNSVFDPQGIKLISFSVRGKNPTAIYLDDVALSCQKVVSRSPLSYIGGTSLGDKVYIYWESSDNPFILRYNVYRQGTVLGSTKDNFYTDIEFTPDTRYNYEVCAVYADGKEGDRIRVNMLSRSDTAAHGNRVKIRGNWIYVDGEKYFVKGVVYSPYRAGLDPRYDYPAVLELLESDIKRIKDAGFNTIRSIDALSEHELIVAEKYGLMVIQGIAVPGEVDFSDTESMELVRQQIVEKVTRSRRHNNILYYVLSGDFSVGAILRSGMDSTSEFLRKSAGEVKRLDPDREVSIAYSELVDYPQLPQFGIVSVDIFRDGPVLSKRDLRYEDFIGWFKRQYARNKPLIVTAFGHSVLVLGPDVEKPINPQLQKEALREDLRSIISAGAAGACVFEWIDQWWRNLEHEYDATCHDNEPAEWFGIVGITGKDSNNKGIPRSAYYTLFKDFNNFYSEALRNSKYDYGSELNIKANQDNYLGGEKARIEFIVRDRNKKPISNAEITYSVIDTRNRIENTYSAKCNWLGACKVDVMLPINTEDTIISIFATAKTEDSRHFANVKHLLVRENKSLKAKLISKIKLVSQPAYEIPKATRRVIIDGKMDDIWRNVKPLTLESAKGLKPVLRVGDCSGADDLYAQVRLLWDKDNLYLLADVKDDMPAVNTKDMYNIKNGDAIELFIGTDINSMPSEGYSSNDFQIVFGANEKIWIYGQADGGTRNGPPSDSEIKVQKKDDGYMLEARLALKNFGDYFFSEGKEIGFDVAVDDADTKGEKECELIWNGSLYNDRDSKYWGMAKLKGVF